MNQVLKSASAAAWKSLKTLRAAAQQKPKETDVESLKVQHGGSHYKSLKIQPVEFIAANQWDYFAGNILKYLTRWRSKGGVEDLKKALHYAELRRDLNITIQRSTFIWWLYTFMDSIWRWKVGMPSWPDPILMEDYLEANEIPANEHQYFHALDDWVKGQADSVWLIYALRRFVERKQHAIDSA